MLNPPKPDRSKQLVPLTAVLAGISIVVNLYVLPNAQAQRTAIERITDRLETHNALLAEFQAWIKAGPRYTEAVGAQIRSQAVTEAVSRAEADDESIRREVASLRDGQASLSKQLGDFRETYIAQAAKLEASVSLASRQLEQAAQNFVSANGKITDVLIKLDAIDVSKGAK